MSWSEFRPFTDYIDIKHFTGYSGGGKNIWKTKLQEEVNKEPDLLSFSQAEGCTPVKGGVLDYRKDNSSVEWPEITCGIYFIRIDDESAKHNEETPSGYYDYIGLSSNFTKKKFQSGIYGRLFDHYRKLVCLPKRGNFGELIIRNHFKDINLSNLNTDQKTALLKKHQPKAIEHLQKQSFEDYQKLRDYFGGDDIGNNLDLYGTTEYFFKVFKACNETNDLNTINGIKHFFKEKVHLSFYKHTFGGEDQFRSKGNNPQINESWKKFVEFIAKGEGVALAAYKKINGKLPYLNKRDVIKNLDILPNHYPHFKSSITSSILRKEFNQPPHIEEN